MFFVFGISQGKKALEYAKTVICAQCGGYGRYQVFMTYSYFSLFFIPIIKWNRHYYVQMSCCSTVYELDPGGGKASGAWRTAGYNRKGFNACAGWAQSVRMEPETV